MNRVGGMRYTKEPWQTRSENQHTEIVGYPDQQSVEFVAETNLDVVTQRPKLSQRTIQLAQANAQRIVVAVNAVAGIPTETLERLGLAGLTKIAEFHAYKMDA